MKSVLLHTVKSWYARDPFTRSAAIAYYTIFSFPSMLILLVGLANRLIDENIIKTQIIGYLQMIVGKEAAIDTFQVIDRVNIYDHNTLILCFSVGMLLFTSLRLFLQIQKALNEIWEVREEKFYWKNLLLRRAYSFGVMLAIGFVLLVSFFLTSVLTALSNWVASSISPAATIAVHVLNILFSLTAMSFLFCLILRILPDRHIPWRNAWRGGLVSALLFMAGQYGLSIYFDLAHPESAYGVSGSLILVMIWVSYSSLALLFGAEFARCTLQSATPLQGEPHESHRLPA